MTRRTLRLLVILTLSCLVAPLAGPTQLPVKIPVLGILLPGVSPSAAQRQRSPFWQRLHERGWREGQTIAVERRFAEGQLDRLPALAADLVQRRPDVILTAGTPAVLAAKQATTTIPIVIQGAAALVEQGIVASLAHPGGNLTGSESTPLGLQGKGVEILKEVRPHLARLALLVNPDNPAMPYVLAGLETEAGALGLELQRVEARHPDDFEAAFAAVIAQRPDALCIEDATPFGQPPNLQRILDFAATHRLLTLCRERRYAEAGCLIAYGYRGRDLWRRAADYVDRILKGARPADLPIERPTTFELVINLTTAQALGITMPPTLLFQADDVIR